MKITFAILILTILASCGGSSAPATEPPPTVLPAPVVCVVTPPMAEICT